MQNLLILLSVQTANEKLQPDDDRTIEFINSVNISIILCGHTHIQGKISHDKRCVLNCGSVGSHYIVMERHNS